MTTWILILFIYQNGAVAQEFASEPACRAAFEHIVIQQKTTYFRGGCYVK